MAKSKSQAKREKVLKEDQGEISTKTDVVQSVEKIIGKDLGIQGDRSSGWVKASIVAAREMGYEVSKAGKGSCLAIINIQGTRGFNAVVMEGKKITFDPAGLDLNEDTVYSVTHTYFFKEAKPVVEEKAEETDSEA